MSSSSSIPAVARTVPPSDIRSERETFSPTHAFFQETDAFTQRVITSLDLGHLDQVAAATTAELVVWLHNHEPSAFVQLTLTWAAPQLCIELVDQGLFVPDLGRSALDAAMAVRLLVQPGVQWGASLDARGRCLWATVDARPYEEHPAPIAVAEAGSS